MKTREELINEMATDICKELKVIQCNKPCISCSEYHYCPLGIDATCAIDAGYRKQSDTVREFVEKLKSSDSKPLAWEYGEGYMDCIKNAVSIAKEYGAEVEE